MTEHTPAEKRALTLAGHALNYGVHDDWPTASATVQQIGHETGHEGLYISLLSWIDSYVSYQNIPEGAPIRIGFEALESGAIGTADDVPADVAWAGRALAARAAMDGDTFDALMEALPEDGAAIARHVMRLLEMCAYGIRRAMAGAS